MSKKKIKTRPKTNFELITSVRSPFATCKMSGAGPHKSKKDYDRQTQRTIDRKNFEKYL